MSNVTETPTSHEVAASEMLVQLRALAQSVGDYGFITKGQRRRLNTVSTLPIPFLLSVAVALDASEALTRAAGITGAQIRDVVALANAYVPVADEMALVAGGMRDTVQAKRADTGQRALRAYRLAKSFNSPSDRELLIPHIEDMKRTLGRGRRKVVKPVAEPKPPATVPPAPAKS